MTQFVFLFCAIEQVIQLICERVFWILLEERLERPFVMLFICDCEIMLFTKGAGERGLPNSTWTDDADEFVHDVSYSTGIEQLQV